MHRPVAGAAEEIEMKETQAPLQALGQARKVDSHVIGQ